MKIKFKLQYLILASALIVSGLVYNNCSQVRYVMNSPASDNNLLGGPASPADPPVSSGPTDDCGGLPPDQIANGSFETLNSSLGIDNQIAQNQLVNLKTWDIYTDVPGWTSIDKKGIELWGAGFNGVTPSDGNVLMEIKGNEPNVIGQNFCSTGGLRTFLIDVASRTGIKGDNIVNVSIDGKQVLQIDPTDPKFKTHTACLNLSKGLHSLQMSSEPGTNPSEGGLIDNVRILTGASCLASVGETTILMSLSEIDQSIAKNIAQDAIDYASSFDSPKILFVRGADNAGEELTDFTSIPVLISGLKYDVTAIDEPADGLTLNSFVGYDIVWYNNPGHSPQKQATLDALNSGLNSRKIGLILSGDDMSWTTYINMRELTHLIFGNNGADACGAAIDNNGDPNKYIVSYNGVKFQYGDDIDQSSPDDSSLEVVSSATTSVPGCSLVTPVVTRYRIQ